MATETVKGFNYRAVANNTKPWWFQDPALRTNMLHCIGLCGTLFFNGYDGSLFNGLQSLDQWHKTFGNPDSTTIGLMNSSGFLPGIFSGYAADRMQKYIGKRWTIWINIAWVMVGIAVMSTSNTSAVFCGGRVIIGWGTNAALAVAPAQLQEISHPRFRAEVGAFYTGTYYIAAILSAGFCLACMNIESSYAWRIPSWLQMFGPVLTILTTCTMPESPRWLIKRGRLDEARNILVKHHANGKEDDPLVQYEFSQIVEAIKEEYNLPQTSYLDFVKSPGNRHRLLILCTVGFSLNWVGNGIISYYLSPILNSIGLTSTTTQLQILVGLNAWNLIMSTIAAVKIDYFGRRPLWLTATTGQLLTMAVIMGLSAGYAEYSSKSAGLAVIPFLFLFYGSYDIAYTPMSYSYPVEILPFSLRTKGTAIYITVVTASVSLNTWANPVALSALQWKYYSVYLVINAALLAIQYFKFPETKNLTIEEIAVIFDGQDAMDRAVNRKGDDVVAPKSDVNSIHEATALKD